jgi:hypothetical protein
MALFLMNHSLSTSIPLAAYNELKQVIKFVLDTKMMGLKMNPKITTNISEWDIVVYTNSDWAGEEETRINVTGFIFLMIHGVPILWKSKG